MIVKSKKAFYAGTVRGTDMYYMYYRVLFSLLVLLCTG